MGDLSIAERIEQAKKKAQSLKADIEVGRRADCTATCI